MSNKATRNCAQYIRSQIVKRLSWRSINICFNPDQSTSVHGIRFKIQVPPSNSQLEWAWWPQQLWLVGNLGTAQARGMCRTNCTVVKQPCFTFSTSIGYSKNRFIWTVSPHVENCDDFSRMFEIANQLLARRSLYLTPRMNGNAIYFRNVN